MTSIVLPGINIFSGADTALGAALTNPTELAREKGCIQKRYSIFFNGKTYMDVEQAYHLLGTRDAAQRDLLMTELIAAKFTQYPELFDQVTNCGGAAFLERCSHWTGAKTEGSQAWEGQGLASRFIRNLVAGYRLAAAGDLTENAQRVLF